MRASLRLIPSGIHHAPVVTEILRLCFDDPWTVKDVREVMVMPGGFGFLAEEGAVPVGYILLQATADEASVLSIGVVPDFRRRGIASDLLEAGERQAAEIGAETMFLEVAADDSGACDFYWKAGYEEIGRREKYYRRRFGRRVDALLLRRVLSE